MDIGSVLEPNSQCFLFIYVTDTKLILTVSTGRKQMEEEISMLAKMSRPASLFPSSLSETDRGVCP